MIELPLVFLGGMVGSGHCLGMCGGFALSIGASTATLRGNLARQLAYSAGRVSTYAVLGAVAGFGGWRLMRSAPEILQVPAFLAAVAGTLLLVQGLFVTGLVHRRLRHSAGAPCLGPTLFGAMLAQPGIGGALIAGLATGLLPCGLLYGLLALAATTRSPLAGAVTMIAFGLGTMPAMLAAGCGASFIGLAGRRRMVVVAGWCLVATGIWTIARGAYFFLGTPYVNAANCPLCR